MILPPEPRVAIADSATQSDNSGAAASDSYQRPYDPNWWSDRQWAAQRRAHPDTLPYAADMSKQRKRRKEHDNHAADWESYDEYRREWAARGSTKETKSFLKVAPCLPNGPRDSPPNCDPNLVERFKNLVHYWIMHTSWMIENGEMPAHYPGQGMTASQWAMK